MSKKRASLRDSLTTSAARADVAAATANALAASLRPVPADAPAPLPAASAGPLAASLRPAPAAPPATDVTVGVRLDAGTFELLRAVALHRVAGARRGSMSVAAVVRGLIHEHADKLRAEIES